MITNSFRPMAVGAARWFSTTDAPHALHHIRWQTFKTNFLSDPSTYPLILIMGCALTFMTGMGLHAVGTYKDVQINPTKRNEILRTWGDKDASPLLKQAVYWNSWQKNAPEGLGVDHKKWLESKKTQN